MQDCDTVQYWEDCHVGERIESGTHTVTRDEILEFAERYDPQPFHVDEAAARESLFEGLIASGWHTAAVCMRLLLDARDRPLASAGGRGVDELRWHLPVYPDDELAIEAEIVQKTPAEGLDGLGEIHIRVEGSNQHDDTVVSWRLLAYVRRRDVD